MSTRTRKTIQYAFRLPHDLAARLEAYKEENGFDLISEAVKDVLEKGLQASRDEIQPVMQDVMHTGYAGLADRLAALEDTVRTLQEREKAAPVKPKAQAVKTTSGTLDPDRHYLGTLCERGHDWQGSGQSRRSKRNNFCMACEAEDAKARRARRKAGTAG